MPSLHHLPKAHYPSRRETKSLESNGSRNITWVSPQKNVTYPAGQTLVAKWDTLLALIVPSFRLCVGEQVSKGTTPGVDGAEGSDTQHIPADRCGSMVYPSVQQQLDGLYFVSLALPNVTSVQPFVLRMQDTLGFEFDSPPFYLDHISPDTITNSAQGNPNVSDGPLSNSLPSQPSASPAAAVTPSLPPGISFNITDMAIDASEATSSQVLVLHARNLQLLSQLDKRGQHPYFRQIHIGHLYGRQDDGPPFPLTLQSSFPSTKLAAVLVPLVLVVASLMLALFLCFRKQRKEPPRTLVLTEKVSVRRSVVPRRPVPRTLDSAQDLESAVRNLGHLSSKESTDLDDVEKGKTFPRPPYSYMSTRPGRMEGGLPELHYDGYCTSITSVEDVASSLKSDPIPMARLRTGVPEGRSLTEPYFSSSTPGRPLPALPSSPILDYEGTVEPRSPPFFTEGSRRAGVSKHQETEMQGKQDFPVSPTPTEVNGTHEEDKDDYLELELESPMLFALTDVNLASPALAGQACEGTGSTRKNQYPVESFREEEEIAAGAKLRRASKPS